MARINHLGSNSFEQKVEKPIHTSFIKSNEKQVSFKMHRKLKVEENNGIGLKQIYKFVPNGF